ncbi:MAG: hypothetical protein GQ559_04790 [Desulfobulbaceae bacterium]|nr:hypothetical protein [Desulfobulbaceae bacterium]
MPQYTCFGITLHSPVQLPLVSSTTDSPSDVVINLTRPAIQDQDQPFFSFSKDWGVSQIIMRPSLVGQFTISNGKIISFQPNSSSNFSSFLGLYLTGSILSLLLYQRGLLVLHGSVVSIYNKAAAFLGHSGAGKSSTAATCCQQGHALLADDITAITLSHDGALVQPGFPRLKVHIQTAEALNIPVESLVAVHPDINDEFALLLNEQFCTRPEPLTAVYLLAEGKQIKIERLSPAAALVELLQHAIPSRYGQNGGAHQFEQLSTLVRQVPIFRLLRPNSLNQLHQLPQLVENHLAGL